MSNEKIARGLVEPIVWKPEESKVPNDCYDNAVNFVRDTFQESCEMLYRQNPSYKFGIVSVGHTTLFDAFLGCLPEDQRQHYTCNTCRQFINKYGRLVRINPDGTLVPAAWGYPEHEDNLGVFADVIAVLRNKVMNGRVTYLFVDRIGKDSIIGKEVNGGFRHFHAGPIGDYVHLISNFSGSMGDFINEQQVSYNLLKDFLSKYANERGLEITKSIKEGFEYGVLSNYNRFRDTLDDLTHVLKYDWKNLESNESNNKIWYHVMHKDLFVRVKNSVLGMLFDDLDSGMDFDKASERFNDAVDPLRYRRSQSLPTINQVNEAQKVIAELGLEPSFHRRHALVSEIPLFWKPQEVSTEDEKEEPSGGLFSNIPTKDYHRKVKTTVSKPTQDAPIDITWAKFQRDVLLNVMSMSLALSIRSRYPFMTILTATNPDAKPIYKYDTEEVRCPFSGYMYQKGATLAMYHLSSNENGPFYDSFVPPMKTVNIIGLCETPDSWGKPGTVNVEKGIIAIIEGASDYETSRVALFPDILIPELYPYRKVIESYSNNTRPDYDERYETENLACGMYLVGEGGTSGLVITVTLKNGTSVKYRFIAFE